MKELNCLIIFFKYPEPGKVKMKLSSNLDDLIVSELYKNFIKDIFNNTLSKEYSRALYFYPKEKSQQIESCFGNYYNYICQEGECLGEKMKKSFIKTFEQGIDNVIIIGTDTPEINSNYIENAFSKLKENDIVIGPIEKGGYNLLGFKKESFFSEVFEEINWGSEDVYNQTINKIEERKLKTFELKLVNNIDNFEDLEKFYKKNKDKIDLETIKYIEENIEI